MEALQLDSRQERPASLQTGGSEGRQMEAAARVTKWCTGDAHNKVMPTTTKWCAGDAHKNKVVHR